MAPKGIRKASQERLGSLSELPSAPRDCLESPRKWHGMPGRVPESARQRFGAVKIDAKSRPGTQKASFSARLFCEALSSRISVDLFVIFRFFVKSSNPPKYRACRQNQGFGYSRYESHHSRDVASKNDENRSQSRPKIVKIRPKIVENRISDPPGHPCRPTFVDPASRDQGIEGSRDRGIEGCEESRDRGTQESRDRGRPEVPKLPESPEPPL